MRRTTATSSHVSYISGDTWNVNPIALKRVEKLFCRNERAVLSARLRRGNHPDRHRAGGRHPRGQHPAAVHRRAAAPELPRSRTRSPCEARFGKGEEMGGFQHGSTIILFVPPGFEFVDGIATGARIRMGQALMRPARRRRPRPTDADSARRAGTGARVTRVGALARGAGGVLACVLVLAALDFVLRDLTWHELRAAALHQPPLRVAAAPRAHRPRASRASRCTTSSACTWPRPAVCARGWRCWPARAARPSPTPWACTRCRARRCARTCTCRRG